MGPDLVYHLARSEHELEEILPYSVWTFMSHVHCLSANDVEYLTLSCFVKFLLSIVHLDRPDIHKARIHDLISVKNILYDQLLGRCIDFLILKS